MGRWHRKTRGRRWARGRGRGAPGHKRALHSKQRPATGCRSLWWACDRNLAWQEQELRTGRVLLSALESRAFAKFRLWQPRPTIEERWDAVTAELTRRGEADVIEKLRNAIRELTRPRAPLAGEPFDRRASRRRERLTYVANHVGVNVNTLKSWLRRLERVATDVILNVHAPR
jgi:hypothetical protein